MATSTKKKPKLSLDELKVALDGFKKEVRVEVPESAIQGRLMDVEKTLIAYVKTSEIQGNWGVYKLSKSSSYRSYGRTYRRSDSAWFVVGYRPYTDEELLKEGNRLVTQKATREKKAEKDRLSAVAKYNAAAAKLGLDQIVG